MSSESQEERLQFLEQNIQSLRDELAETRVQLREVVGMLNVKNDSGPSDGRLLIPQFYDRPRK